MEKINLGKVCVTPRGDYNIDKTYEVLDIVMYLGNTYVCIDPALPITNAAGWMIIARTNGIIGADGADGKSAYDLAVIEGFDGTLEEWLLQLKGDKGEKGDSGSESTVNGKATVTIQGGDNITITEDGSIITISGKPGDVTKKYVDEQDLKKVDKVSGKGLSTNDYTTVEKEKLADIEDGANNYNDSVILSELSRIEAIANGRNKARVFDDLTDVTGWLLIPENLQSVEIGDQFLTRALGVPDYWWDGAELQILETEKVDLDSYIEYSDIADNLTTDNSNLVLSAKQGKVINDKLAVSVLKTTQPEVTSTEQGTSLHFYGTELKTNTNSDVVVDLPLASSASNGIMPKEDKEKIDSVVTGAQPNVIEKVSVDGVLLPVSNKSVNVNLKNKVDKITNNISDVTAYVPVLTRPKTQQPNLEAFSEPGSYFLYEQDVQSWPSEIPYRFGILNVIRSKDQLQDIDCVVQTYYPDSNANTQFTPLYRIISSGIPKPWHKFSNPWSDTTAYVQGELAKCTHGIFTFSLFDLPETASSEEICTIGFSNLQRFVTDIKNKAHDANAVIVQTVANRFVNGILYREKVAVSIRRITRSSTVLEYHLFFVDTEIVNGSLTFVGRDAVITESTIGENLVLSIKNYKTIIDPTIISRDIQKLTSDVETVNQELHSFDAANITQGTIDIDRLPKAAIERLLVVADDAERFGLTTDTIQKGDTVKVNSSGKMYFVVDDTKLSTEDGYEPYTASAASSVAWSGVTSKPTTIGGYGITDGLHTNDVKAWAKTDTKPTYTATEIGLGNVNNTSDENKLVSIATQAVLDTKVDKVDGMGLSTENYTTTEKEKLRNIEPLANNYSHPGYPGAANGLYKVSVDNTGHITESTPVTATDILALGVAQRGETGATGPAGAPGPAGPAGEKGEKGDTASITGDLVTVLLGSLPIDVYNQKYTYTAASANVISFKATPLEGSEFALSIKNGTSSNITQPIPNGVAWQTEVASVIIPAGKIIEIFIKYVHGIYVVRT